MAGNPQVLGLLEEILDSGKTPEEVCLECPDLLPEVRRRWEDFRRIDAGIGMLLPGLRQCRDGAPPAPSAAGLPTVPGYDVEAVLGRGGMGVVYRARHSALKRTVALKMLAGSYSDPAELARFRAEAEAVARLQHPNIVQVYEIGEAGGRPFIALEFVAGGSLAERLAGRPLPPRDAARLVAAIAEGMHLAHSRNLVHRDLKPGNVLLAGEAGTPAGLYHPKVTDFGLARRMDADSGQTRVGVVMGTPSYMAPEQAEGRAHAAGPPADVYALGAILYECLTGRPPFQGVTPLATLDHVRTREPVAPSALRRGVPRDLETICLKCLRKPPERRYSSARELADDLGRFVRGEPVAARPVGAAEGVRKWVRRRPAAAGLLAAVVLLVSAAGVRAWQLSEERAEARGRQTRTDQEVRRTFERARAKLEAGWGEHDLTKLTEAGFEAGQAEGIAHNGGASPEVRQEAEALQGEVAGRLGRARKNRELMDTLLEISTAENASYKLGDDGEQEYRSADEQFGDAFLRWGLDVNHAADAEVVTRLGAEPDVVVQELISALDNWIQARHMRQSVSRDWPRLYRIAERLDRNERRRRLRALLADPSSLHPGGLAAAVGAASPWRAAWELTRGDPRGDLRVTLRESDPATEPPLTVALLADVCLAKGDLAGAERVLRRALMTRPDHVVLVTRLARLLYKRGPARYGEAIGCYRAAYSLRPSIGRSLCHVLSVMGRYEEAEEFCRDMMRAQPENPEFHYRLCTLLMNQGRYRELEEVSRRLIDLRPNSAMAHTAFGLALAGRKDFAGAEKAYRKAIALKPRYAWAFNNLGMLLAEAGRHEEASAAYQDALAAETNFHSAHINLGNLLTTRGQFREAAEHFRKAVALQPTALAYAALGSFLVNQLHDTEGAEAAFRKAIALQPNYPLASTNLVHVLLRQGKHVESADICRQVLATNPNDVSATKLLSQALMGLGRGDEARATWRPQLDAHAGEHEAWDGYPELCLFLGRDDEYRRARAAYLKRFAASADPFVACKTARASLLLPCSDDELRTAGALAEVAAASRKPGLEWLRPQIVFTKGLVDYRRGRLDGAIALTEGEASEARTPAPGLVLAMAKYQQGRAEDARKTFTAAVLAYDWSESRSDDQTAWISHVLRREAEAMILPTLPAFLKGTHQARQQDERLALSAARLVACQAKGLRCAAARLYSDLFLAEPKLAEAWPKGVRFHAARAAVLAGCGKGKDADQSDDKDRARFRRQALEWLRQDLTGWTKMADGRDTRATAKVTERLRGWQTDYDLAGVRTRDALARLPEEEREPWERFWSDVDSLLRRANRPE